MPDLQGRLAAELAERYEVRSEIGRGGMATVFLAEDLRHRRKVAIKVLHPELTATLGAERFLHEIEIVANLQHPHILPLFESGEAGDLLYYVMPYAEGESLRQRLDREKHLPVEESVRIAAEVADGLDYAHRKGVVHRDIKPGNIMFSQGHAVIADFGIARAVSEAGGEALTRTGLAIGTPAYMSPEQAAGDPNVDGRSDLYSLACVVYEMLAGETPFMGGSAQAILAKKLSERPAPLSLLRDTVPPAVEQTITRALARVPADRFTTAEQFVTALETGPESVAGLAPLPGTASRRAPAARPRWRRRALALGGLVVVAVAAAVSLLRHPPAPPALRDDLITVLPFEAAGGTPRVQELAGQVPNAFWAVLDGKYGPQLGDVALVRDKWEAAGGTVAKRLPEASALRLAEEMGSGRLVYGQMIGTEQDLRLTATLLEVPSGEPRVFRTSVSGSADQFATLVDSLIVLLLAEDYGEIGERLPGLASHPNEAVLTYLDGDYGRALELDSTFILAGMKAYSRGGELDGELARFVWDHRDELGPRDRAYFKALAGWRFGATPDVETWIAQFDSARKLAPDGRLVRTDELDKLLHWGPLTELDWVAQAHKVIGELTQIDSVVVLCLGFRGWLAALELDPDAYRRHWESCADYRQSNPEGYDAQSFLHPVFVDDPRNGMHGFVGRWVLANLAGDSAAMAAASAELAAFDDSVRFGMRPAWNMSMFGPALHGRGVADTDHLMATYPSGYKPVILWARWRGQRERYNDYVDVLIDSGYSQESTPPVPVDAAVVAGALFLDMPVDERVQRAADRLQQVARGEIDPGVASGNPEPKTAYPMMASCWSTLWKLLQDGDASEALEAANRLRVEAELPHRWAACAGMIEVEATRIDGRDAGPLLARLDSLMRRGPNPAPWDDGVHTTGVIPNLLLARELAQHGDPEGALAAARRRTNPIASGLIDGGLLPEFLREEGRLAALTGDVPGAIRAYEIYLALRDAPTGYEPWDAERRAVQEELAALSAR